VSWQAATMLALAVVLVAGMVWYERSRPPSQVIALVAALAALAVAGRVALAPIPNVVPTTDIALISGYALGPAPGFAVGSLAALVSNFWLGQGPWTPWQMAGWGMCGIGGALLAVGFARRLGRVGLAVACAAAGFAYGALLDLSLMVTYGGEQSLDRFLALSARGLPFNVAHAAGNAALALIAGPALVRMLVRYRERFEFAWSRPSQPLRPLRHRRAPRPGAAAGAGCLLAATVAIALASGEIARGAGGNPGDARAASGGVGAAVDWLRGAQNMDGGFGTDPGEASSPEMTGWAMLGLAAARVNPLDVSRDGRNPVAYLRSTADRIRTTGDIERTILALAAAGVDPDGIGGGLVARLRNRRGRDG